MRFRTFALALLVSAGSAVAQLTYPEAPAGDVVDTYHGVSVPDPYRWLEDYTDQTNAWIEAQAKFTSDWLARVPQRAAIKDRLTRLWNYERFGVPSKQGERYVYSRNDGLQNQNVLLVADALKAEPRVLLDPNAWSADGTMALAGISFTDDGSLMAYGIAEAGSDWNTWKVKDVATGKDLPDEIHWVKFGGPSWTIDNKGFFYSRFDEPKEGESLKGLNKFQKIYYHRLGTPQSDDILTYRRDDQPEWYMAGGVTEAGDYFVIGIGPGDKVENGLFYKDLANDGPVVELLNRFDAQYSFVGNEGPVFFVQADLEAPRGRVWAIDVRKPERENWKEVIPQAAEALQGVGLVGDRFFCQYLKDAKTLVRIHDMAGKPVGEVQLPGIGSAGGFSGKRKDKETFYSFASYTVPGAVYRYDINAGRSEVFRKPTTAFKGEEHETRQVFYTSKDGTRVPMFITHRKGMKLDGGNPTLLYGYGGFNVPITPAYSPMTAAWLEMGGVYAVANIRGGSEYGEEWHQGGMRLNKQNCFDDFIAAAEWLIAGKYTTSSKLAIHGGSNGGLLVGACMTQRPELFGACIPAVGVMDMLRFQKFTVGWGWVGDYGSSDNPDQFKVLHSFSPYHNLKKGECYPPTLVTTADHDDRVYPAHSFKFAAAAQAAQGCDNPILIRIELRAGHGAGKPTSKRIEEAADVLSFLVSTFKMDPKVPSESNGG